jgi:hypothetical protein
MRRTRPAAVSRCSESYTVWWDTSGKSPRTAPMIESVSACGCACTALSTATRGRVTRRAAPRSIRWKSNLVTTLRSMAGFLESVKSSMTVTTLIWTRPGAAARQHAALWTSEVRPGEILPALAAAAGDLPMGGSGGIWAANVSAWLVRRVRR